MRFEWDPFKERLNVKKHGFSFKNAVEAVTCGLVILLKQDYRNEESRYVFLGIDKNLTILVVVVSYASDEVTRIISARKANKKEREYYEAQL